MQSYDDGPQGYIKIQVSDLEKSKAFYKSVVETLGYTLTKEDRDGFWIDELYFHQSTISQDPEHLAFPAKHPVAVKLFHETALSLGGESHRAPGASEALGEYSSCVQDPDGNRLEAIFHRIHQSHSL